MYNKKIGSLDVAVELFSDDINAIKYLSDNSFLENHIPSLQRSTQKIPGWKIFHETTQKSSVKYNVEDKQVLIQGKFQQDTSKHDLTFLLATLFSDLHEQKGRVLFHSSSVQSDDKSYLIIGGRGGGKSILATELVYKHGQKLIGGETSIIEGTKIIGGTRTVTNRIPCLRKRYPELIKENQITNDYELKTILPKDTYEITESSSEIAEIYLINLDDNNSETDISKPAIHGVIYELMMNSGAYTAGTGHTMMNFSVPHPNLDNQKYRTNRLQTIKSLINQVPILEIRGPINKSAEYILSKK